ncbi:hypothetical protein GCM10007159_35650 [Modicisalibacter luteus]|nr:hypothetical protein GCM10007159_35650 [Halomonas lutea]
MFPAQCANRGQAITNTIDAVFNALAQESRDFLVPGHYRALLSADDDTDAPVSKIQNVIAENLYLFLSAF